MARPPTSLPIPRRLLGGQVTQEVLGDGVVTDRAFDLIGNLTERRDVRYATPFSETFGYDSLNRLKSVATSGSAGVTADYNDLGNLTRRSDAGDFSCGSRTDAAR